MGANDALHKVTGNITAAGTGAGSSVAVNLAEPGSPTGPITALLSGTYAGVTVVAEGDPDGTGTAWQTLELRPIPSYARYPSVALTDNATAAYLIPRNGMAAIRVRATARTSGTVAVSLQIARGVEECPPTALTYKATRPTLTDGQSYGLMGNARGDLSVAEAYAPQFEDGTNQVAATSRRFMANGAYSPGKLVGNYGANVTLNAKASAGVVTAIWGKNRNAAIRHLQLHDTATTPSAAAVPKCSFEVAIAGTVYIGEDILSENGMSFTNGIAYAWSTTAGTYTAATASEHDTQVWGV